MLSPRLLNRTAALAGASSALIFVAAALTGCFMDLDETSLADDQGDNKNGGAPTKAHPAVGQLTSLFSECSAVLIAPSYVLSAAHCYRAAGSFVVESADGTRFTRSVVDSEMHPSYVPDVETIPNFQFDVMVLELDAPLSDIAVMPLAVGNPQPKDTVEIVGYGITAAGGLDAGVKRQKAVIVESVDEHVIHIEPSAPGITDGCQGDSGGALLREEEGKAVQVGIISYVYAGCTSTHAVSIPSWRPWIDETVALLAARTK